MGLVSQASTAQKDRATADHLSLHALWDIIALQEQVYLGCALLECTQIL